jgi:MFS family permease
MNDISALPLWKKNLRILWAAQFIAMIAMSACLPFLPLFVRSLGITDLQQAQQWSGVISAGPFFLSIISVPFWGSLGDKYGRKLMIVRAIVGLALAMGLMGLAQNVWQLLFLRMLQGAISGFIASTLAFVSSTTPKQHSGYAIAILQSSVSAGPVVGSFVGGILSDAVGVRAVFLYVAIACLISAIIVTIFVHEEKSQQAANKNASLMNNLRYVATMPTLRTLVLLIFLVQSSIVFFSPVLPFYIEQLGAPHNRLSTITGVFIGIGGFVQCHLRILLGEAQRQKRIWQNHTISRHSHRHCHHTPSFCSRLHMAVSAARHRWHLHRCTYSHALRRIQQKLTRRKQSRTHGDCLRRNALRQLTCPRALRMDCILLGNAHCPYTPRHTHVHRMVWLQKRRTI